MTILVTMTDQQLASGTGYATTGHGSLIPVTAILDLAGEAQTVGVVVNSDGGVMNYGQTKRLVPASMRRALIARDQGCTFPGCDMPPAWTQAHHFREFAAGGETSIENCGLVCGHHHRTFEKHGWRSVMINAIPHFIPPKWIDPDQKPLRNTTHHPTLNLTRV